GPYPRTGLKPSASPLTSVVAGDAVERGPRAVRGILLAVAGHAPSHRERARRRLETNELLQVVGEQRPGFGPDHPHALDRAVARLAREAEPHVGLVSDIHEAAVGEVRGLGGEAGGRGAVALPRRAVTECALRGIERLARVEIEG